MAINKEWHEKNRMPKNPSTEQRIKWHIEHSKHCTCREMPPKLKLQVEEWLQTHKH
jgi:hypothetical protein